MAVTTIDTLKFVRKLEQVGVPSEQAEVQAELLTEAFNVNLEELVTKDHLETRLDVRFAEQTAYIDTQFAEIRGNFRTLYWILSIVVAATVLPLLQNLANFQ